MVLVLHPEFHLYERKDKVFCTTLQVAEEFKKRHDLVLRDVRELDCSQGFRLRSYEESSYRNEQNKKQPMYFMTRDGFMFLVMGYRGEKAAVIKELYIQRFNDMEAFIKDYVLARDEFLPFTRAIEFAHDEPKSYHYSNEYDMINRIVLGCTAKQFKALHDIPANVSSIRPYLSQQQVKAIRALQNEDIPMLYQHVAFQARKTALIGFYNETLAIGG